MFNLRKDKDFTGKGLGWIADNPDLRDYRLDDDFLDSLKPEKCTQNLKIISETLKRLKHNINVEQDELEQGQDTTNLDNLGREKLDNLIDYLEFESEKYSVFSIHYFDVIKPQNSHPKVKEFKYHLYCFFQYIKEKDEINDLKSQLSEDENSKIDTFNELAYKDIVHWMRSEYHDAYLTVLVKLFQTFVKHGQNLEGEQETDIEVDGIIGIDTFKALSHCLKFGFDFKEQGNCEKYHKALPIPFPSPIPPEVLSLVLTNFLPQEIHKKLRERFEKDFESKVMPDAVKDSFLRTELLYSPSYKAQRETYINFRFYSLADFIAKEYYLLIEPFILVILQFLGAIGAYKNLDYAIKIAASQFKFIINPDPDIDELQKIVDDIKLQLKPNQQNFNSLCYVREALELGSISLKSQYQENSNIDSQSDINLGGLENLLAIIDLKILGSTEKLPDEFRLELIEEIENLRWLRQVSYWAIFQFINRFYQEFLVSRPSEQKPGQKKDNWYQESRNDFQTLLFGDDDGTTTGLVAETINLSIRAIKRRNKKEGGSLEEGKIVDKERVEKFLEMMKEYLDEKNFLDLLEDKPSIIEFKHDNALSTIESGLEKVIEEKTKERFGCKNSFDRSASIFEFSSTYKIPVGDNLVQSLYLNSQAEQGEQCNYFAQLPHAVDLTYWCSPVSDQRSLNACTAHAGVALLEYFARQYANDPELLSIPFLYKVTRNLANHLGNVGASPRETVRAMVSVGVPPARFWKADEENFDADPPNFTYSLAQNFQTLSYFRIDHPDVPKDDLLTRIKIVLAAGFPCMFGFTIYQSIYEDFNVRRGFIPYPSNSTRDLRQLDTAVGNNAAVGGHAVVAIGYNNYKRVPLSRGKGYSQGAILIRNSWGSEWGIGGYGWLPYDYVLKGLTSDYWSLINAEWLKTGRFGLGGSRNFGGKCPASGCQ